MNWEKVGQGTDKSHHTKDGFTNPWESFRPHHFGDFFKLLWKIDLKQAPANKVPVQPIDFELVKRYTDGKEQGMLLTWLGHAAILLSLPGSNILLDPCLSDRCSPVSFAGPKRMIPPPCKLEELPDVNVVIISHNHYDHLDLPTMVKIARDDTLFFVPLGNKELLEGAGIKNVIECDWYDEYNVTKENHSFKVCCTPCQHFTGRGVLDRFKSLWSSWVVTSKQGKFFFGGDTGYRTVREGEKDEEVPFCPAFKEIGAKYGPFDLAAIPIGAYSPRWFMSSVHCDPRDSVDVHVDIKSKLSIGMHWGTFQLTDEPYDEPPKRLLEELKKKELDTSCFRVINVGESIPSHQ